MKIYELNDNPNWRLRLRELPAEFYDEGFTTGCEPGFKHGKTDRKPEFLISSDTGDVGVSGWRFLSFLATYWTP